MYFDILGDYPQVVLIRTREISLKVLAKRTANHSHSTACTGFTVAAGLVTNPRLTPRLPTQTCCASRHDLTQRSLSTVNSIEAKCTTGNCFNCSLGLANRVWDGFVLFGMQ